MKSDIFKTNVFLAFVLWAMVTLSLPSPLWGKALPQTKASTGVTVVSDTTDTEETETDSAVTSRPQNSFFAFPDTDADEDDSFFSFSPVKGFFSLLGVGGVMFFLLGMAFLFAPVLLVVLLIVYLMRRDRKKRKQPAEEPSPGSQARTERPRQNNPKERLVRCLAWSAGLLLSGGFLHIRLVFAAGLLVACLTVGEGILLFFNNKKKEM